MRHPLLALIKSLVALVISGATSRQAHARNCLHLRQHRQAERHRPTLRCRALNRPLTNTPYKEQHPFNTCTETPMAETWLKYSDLANALGITPEAARQKAIRGRWRRQRGNDGKALVLVDLDAEQASHVPRKRPDEHLAGRPDERRTIEALESHMFRSAGRRVGSVANDHGSGAHAVATRCDCMAPAAYSPAGGAMGLLT
jgi:hypothetical protein